MSASDRTDTWKALATSLRRLRADHACLDALRHALNIEPYSAAIWARIGLVQRDSNRPQQALHAFDIALKLDPTCEVALQAQAADPHSFQAAGRAAPPSAPTHRTAPMSSRTPTNRSRKTKASKRKSRSRKSETEQIPASQASSPSAAPSTPPADSAELAGLRLEDLRLLIADIVRNELQRAATAPEVAPAAHANFANGGLDAHRAHVNHAAAPAPSVPPAAAPQPLVAGDHMNFAAGAATPSSEAAATSGQRIRIVFPNGAEIEVPEGPATVSAFGYRISCVPQ